MSGIPYTNIPTIIKNRGGELYLNPLEKWGMSRLWRASKRAEKHGLVTIRRVSAGLAVVRVSSPEGEAK